MELTKEIENFFYNLSTDELYSMIDKVQREIDIKKIKKSKELRLKKLEQIDERRR